MIRFYIFLAILLVVLDGCHPKQAAPQVKDSTVTQPAPTALTTKDDCSEIPRVEWSHIEAGYDKKTTLDLATKLQAAIDADAKKLSAVGSGKVDLKASASLEVTKLFSQREYKVANVSQEIFDQGIAFRTTVCNLWQLIKVGALTPKQKDKVIDDMLSYSKKFNNIASEEKKNLISE